MKSLMDRLRTPEWWIVPGLFCAFLGLVLMFLGQQKVGRWFMLPLVIEVGIIVLVVIPFLIYHNWKLRKQGKEI